MSEFLKNVETRYFEWKGKTEEEFNSFEWIFIPGAGVFAAYLKTVRPRLNNTTIHRNIYLRNLYLLISKTQ